MKFVYINRRVPVRREQSLDFLSVLFRMELADNPRPIIAEQGGRTTKNFDFGAFDVAFDGVRWWSVLDEIVERNASGRLSGIMAR